MYFRYNHMGRGPIHNSGGLVREDDGVQGIRVAGA